MESKNNRSPAYEIVSFLSKKYPNTFVVENLDSKQKEEPNYKPLKIGIFKDISDALFTPENEPIDNEEEGDIVSTTEAINTAEETVGKTLNGAQTQSLLTVMKSLAEGSLTEGQAINIISTAIGVTKEEAKAIIKGE